MKRFLISMLVICLIFVTFISRPAMAQSSNQPEWIGRWTCNLDGRPAILELSGNTDPNTCWYDEEACGFLCTLIGGTNVAGRFSDDGGPWKTIYTRPFYRDQGELKRYEHIIPLEVDKEPWLLLMHTWDKNYMSGYTTWHDRVFGIQCNR